MNHFAVSICDVSVEATVSLKLFWREAKLINFLFYQNNADLLYTKNMTRNYPVYLYSEIDFINEISDIIGKLI